MIKRLVTILLILLTVEFPVIGQIHEQCFISNYSSDSYNASTSNWEITQNPDGLVFIANFEGPLIFNSGSWTFLPSGSAILSISLSSLGQVYFGTNTSFGSLNSDVSGQPQLSSLSTDLKDVGLIWGITPCHGKVYFFSKTHIYQWNGHDIEIIESGKNNFNYKLICDNQSLYLTKTNAGIIKLTTSGQELINGTQQIAEQNLMDFHQKDDSNYTLITRQDGRFEFSKDSITALNKLELDNEETSIFNLSHLNRDGLLAIATQSKGVVITEPDLSVRDQINQDNGLISNSIKSIYVDKSDNLWTANQNGISYIEYGSPWRIIDRGNNLSGIVTTLSRKANVLYIGTTEGLYQWDERLKQIDGMTSRIWNTQVIGDTLGILTTDGFYTKINQQFVKQTSDPQYVLRPLGVKFLIFKNNGISITNSQFDIEKHISIEENTFIDAEIVTKNRAFATAKFKGVYIVSDILSDNPQVQLFNEQNGLPDVAEIHLTKYKNKVLFTTSEGLYEYKSQNPDSLKFVPFNGPLKPQGHLRLVEKDNQGNFYFTIRNDRTDRLEMYRPLADGSFKKVYKPFKRLPDMEITTIYPDQDSILWVGGSEGLFKYDAKIKKDYRQPFNTLVSKVTTNDSLLFGGFYAKDIADSKVPAITIEQPESYQYQLPYENNNFIFEFAAAYYEMPEKTQFSYILQNNDEKWSSWSTETKKEYTNLPAGKYNFLVKSKNIYDTEGQVASYKFTILPPWHQTIWAYTGFTILAILFVWFVSLAYSYRVRMQRRRLKLIVADRTFEVLSQKKEIESQNHLLKDQFGEITKQKDEIQEKNTELQQSQEEILTINEKLNELNQHLEKKVENRTARIKATLEQLKKTNKELDTFVYRASHDLKGPISRIHGLTSLAKLEVSEEDTKYYDLIENAALDMQGLLSKLSNAYEIMNKTLDPETIDLPFLLSEIRNEIKFLDQGTQYAFDLQEKLSLETDKYLFKIIITNLIENALIFRKQRNDHHEVKISCHEDQKHFFFQIADNGIGINPDQSEKIYEMFFRGSDQSKGSGLGLYIVRLALEKINGSVTLDSTLYEYSSFTVKIPLGNKIKSMSGLKT